MSASRARRSATKSLWIASTGLLILPIALAAGLITLHVRGERLLSVQTASMVPVFHPGDALITKPVPASRLRSGDIIAYRSRLSPNVIITHRLIGREPDGRLITAGDSLQTTDPPFSPQQVTGRAVAVAPGLGRVLDFVRKSTGLTLFIYLPAAGIIAAELNRLRHTGRPVYLVHWRYATKG